MRKLSQLSENRQAMVGASVVMGILFCIDVSGWMPIVGRVFWFVLFFVVFIVPVVGLLAYILFLGLYYLNEILIGDDDDI